mmetsp:Transcript_33962/g.65729  ORF Transcript_33962/g.65729 Transcript_33962/m.65729 type:complete len:177 (+) Transcript_33962:2-532(+)
MSVPPGIPPSMMPGMGTAGMMAGGKAMKGGPAVAAGVGAGALNPNVAAEAGLAAAAAAAAASAAATGDGAGGEKAAVKCPTDEEVRALLSRLSVAAEATPSVATTDEVPEQGAPGLQIETAAPRDQEEGTVTLPYPIELAVPKDPDEPVPEKTPVPAIAEKDVADETEKAALSEAA